VLDVFGLGDEEEDVYRYLLATKPTTAEDVQAGTGMQLVSAQRALARLEEAGFTQRVLEDPGRYAPASPGAVDAAILRRLADLREAQERIGELATRYRATRLEADSIGVFEVIKGAGALRERTREMVTSARSEALNMLKPPLIAMQPADHVEPDAAVRGRVIYDRDLVRDADVLDTIRQRPGRHYEVRVHTVVPVKMLAIDQSMALLPVQQHDETPVGVLITESAVLDSFLALFDYVWETATALPAATGDDPGHPQRSPLSAEDRQLLSLLLAGLTDQAIAGHFRVSVRTVERRVRTLMDTAHVRTRMQLAWEAARQHWL
jgi:sugar-specific transcriptional regulator TrmB/DNA-binding CsgD family transcriptional regulator